MWHLSDPGLALISVWMLRYTERRDVSVVPLLN